MKFIKWLINSGLAEESEIKGIAEAEITGIEQERGVSLPDDYKEFLRQCGRSAGLFARDIHLFYPDFLGVEKIFHDVAEEYGIDYRPPVNAFFFSEYQGGSFHYFLCGDNDRTIYVINEGDIGPRLGGDSFTSFVRFYLWLSGRVL